jgi:hypothetical protein
MYGSYVRHQNFRREMAEHDYAIRTSGTPEAEGKARAKKAEFVRQCERDNHQVLIG